MKNNEDAQSGPNFTVITEKYINALLGSDLMRSSTKKYCAYTLSLIYKYLDMVGGCDQIIHK